VRTWPEGFPRRELWLVGAAVVLGIVVRLVFVAATSGHQLAGDEIEYNIEGAFAAAGKFLWTTTPFGIPHETLWKAPGYPAFVGAVYELVGSERYDRLFVVQAILVTPLVIGGIWLLARRLLDPRLAIWAAFGAAVYPFIWIWQVRLFSETLALPIFIALMLVVIDRVPSPRRAAGAGALIGALLLVRPALGWAAIGVAAAWIVAAGPRRGLVFTALSAAVALLVIAPWTIRNHVVDDGAVVLISIQDAAAYGTFNDEAANDEKLPWAWRPAPKRDLDVFREPKSDTQLREELIDRARDYIADHPTSVFKAAYWNGLRRTWDLRSSEEGIAEGLNQGRSKAFTRVARPIYAVMLALALYGLWVIRRRPEIVWPLAAMVGSSIFLYASVSSARSRAGFEVFVLILAIAGGAAIAERVRSRRANGAGSAGRASA